MFNYQPLKVSDEWKLFKYNLRAIFSSKRLPMLEQRINKDTYMFIFVCSFLVVYWGDPFLLGFYKMGIITKEMAVNSIYLFTILQICLTMAALRKRIQDLGISGDVVFLIIFGILFYTDYTWLGVDSYLDNPYVMARGRYTSVATLKTPFPFDLIQMVAFLAMFLPQSKKQNRYGDFREEGIWLWGKHNAEFFFPKLPWEETTRPFKNSPHNLLYVLWQFKKFILNAFNFRGRTTTAEFNGLGFVLLIPHYVILAYIYQGLMVDKTTLMLCGAIQIIFLIPSMSLYTRRLHDSYHSALWILFMYVPFINLYVYYLLFAGCSWSADDMKELCDNKVV